MFGANFFDCNHLDDGIQVSKCLRFPVTASVSPQVKFNYTWGANALSKAWFSNFFIAFLSTAADSEPPDSSRLVSIMCLRFPVTASVSPQAKFYYTWGANALSKA